MLPDGTPSLPGLLRRGAAGAWHIPGGVGFLVRRPRLWPVALLPSVLVAVLGTSGLLLGLYAGPAAERALLPASLPPWMGVPATLALWTSTVTAGGFLGLGIGLLIAAPVLDRLSREVETLAVGAATDADRGLRWEVAQSLRGAVYFLSRAPGILLVGFVPLVGPALSGLWAAHALAFQNTDSALARRGLDFAARRSWHRLYRPESLGLGLASLLCLVVPCAGFLLAPALVTGGTRLVLELTGPGTAS